MRRNGKKWLAALMLIFLLSGCLPAGASAEKKLIWPSHVKVVGESMFEGDTSIENVVLPEGVEEIGSRAFADSSLKAIYLPSTLKTVAPDAFGDLHPILRMSSPREDVLESEGYELVRNLGMVEFRALVIGEKTFYSVKEKEVENNETHEIELKEEKTIHETAWRNKVDADRMEAKLKSVSGYTGAEDRFMVRKEIDLTYEGIRSAIETTFAGTKSQDVSVFFIATHGAYGSGDLSTCRTDEQRLPLATLADWLNTYVQGKVIVILESCYAGYAIYSPDVQENGIKENGMQMMNSAKTGVSALTEEDQFAELAVKVFAEKDPGVPVRQGPESDSTGGLRKRSGEMRVENKFYVLAASSSTQKSFGIEGSYADSWNYFTKWLVEGVGNKKNSPADTSPKDGMLTLQELFSYISAVGDNYKMITDHGTFYQHVQCYPKDCNFVCFLLR